MSVLGLDEVLKRIKEENLIEGLGGRDVDNPEGVGIDLRLGGVYKIVEGGAFIEADGPEGLGKRKGVKSEVMAEYKSGEVTEVRIEAGEYYLVKTIESLNVPDDLMPVVYPRGSLQKSGLYLFTTKTDPGYRGFLGFGLYNFSKFPVKFQLGARFCNIVFFKIEGKVVKYRGQHQGGRVAIEEEERQV
jgi:deoxycytidine triphosphate deaminase